MTIEEKAKAYDEALERARLYKGLQAEMSVVFPELKESEESEDEQHRKWILEYLYDGLRKSDEQFKDQFKAAIAWLKKQGENTYNKELSELLHKVICRFINDPDIPYSDREKVSKEIIPYVERLEKQGEHANFRNKIQIGDKVTRNRDGMLVNLSQLNRVAKKDENQEYQKPADKVEPKFKVGDWVIDKQGIVHQIANVIENVTYHTYGYDIVGGGYFNDNTEGVRLWTIQDAKDGDVLACESGWTCIFKKLNHNSFGGLLFDSYCFIDRTGWFCDGAEGHTLDERINGKIYPATKEQRDLLFQKMHEACYVWDADKKELKKIKQSPLDVRTTGYWHVENAEQNPAWSEEDEKMINSIAVHLNATTCGFPEDRAWADRFMNWLNFIKDRVQPQIKQEWSEEDEEIVEALNNYVKNLDIFFSEIKIGDKDILSKEFREKVQPWFKSLKERIQPQPKQEWSEEDERRLNIICGLLEDIPSHQNWLRTLKDRVITTKVTCDEKDKEKLESIINKASYNCCLKNDDISFLKSLKDRFTWKPSDKQMKWLHDAIESTQYEPRKQALISLYSDLMKLKEK